MKIFRKIRKKVFSENKYTKYFLYALGEIMLIVIGILIALQLDNYNSNLNRNQSEVTALENLKVDFEHNHDLIEKDIEQVDLSRTSCLQILQYTGKNYSDDFEIDSILQYTPNSPTYFPKNGFLLDLMNSGNLGLIKNDLLRKNLSSWLPILENLKNQERICDKYDHVLSDFISKHGNWRNSDNVSSYSFIRQLNLPESGFDNSNSQLLRFVEFENLIENQLIFRMLLLERQRKVSSLNEEILVALETEIDKKAKD